MTNPLTAAEAATEIGASLRTVQRLCEEHGIGSRFGRALMLSASDVARLRSVYQGGPGNPNFTPGNRFGKPAE